MDIVVGRIRCDEIPWMTAVLFLVFRILECISAQRSDEKIGKSRLAITPPRTIETAKDRRRSLSTRGPHSICTRIDVKNSQLLYILLQIKSQMTK